MFNFVVLLFSIFSTVSPVMLLRPIGHLLPSQPALATSTSVVILAHVLPPPISSTVRVLSLPTGPVHPTWPTSGPAQTVQAMPSAPVQATATGQVLNWPTVPVQASSTVHVLTQPSVPVQTTSPFQVLTQPSVPVQATSTIQVLGVSVPDPLISSTIIIPGDGKERLQQLPVSTTVRAPVRTIVRAPVQKLVTPKFSRKLQA